MTMNLYSAVRFRLIGSSIQNNQPMLVADDGTIVSVGDLKWSDNRTRFESLLEGTSTVISLASNDCVTSTEGWCVTRLPDFRTNRMVYDKHSKEIVMLTNGVCALKHDTPRSFQESHAANDSKCHYAPSEAIALRAFIDNGKAVIAWTCWECQDKLAGGAR